MKKALGLAAAAALGTIGATSTQALAKTQVGTVSVGMQGGIPLVFFTSSHGSPTNVQLIETWGTGANVHSRTAYVGRIGASGATVAFMTPLTADFRHFGVSGNTVTANVMFQVVGNGISSPSFRGVLGGLPAASVSLGAPPPVDWIGIGGGSSVSRTFAAPLFASAVPEPATLLVLSAGLLGLGAARRRRL